MQTDEIVGRARLLDNEIKVRFFYVFSCSYMDFSCSIMNSGSLLRLISSLMMS